MAAASASYDAAAALAIPGVEKVVEIAPVDFPTQFSPLGGLAVIARNTYLAMKGRDALVIEWDDGPNAGYDSEAYREALSQAANAPGGTVVRDEGDLDAAMAGATQTLEAEYYIPHLAQAPMEPPAAVVEIRDGRAEAWACTQAPQVTRLQLAERLGLAPEDVTVNVTLLGGGFGRKSKPDFVFEAAECSRAMDGAPVKLTWTREDDIRQGYFHTVSVEKMSAGLDEGGRPGGLAAPHGGAHDRVDLRARPQAQASLRAGHGAPEHAAGDRERQGREPRGRGACPHRVVPRGVEHPARLRDPVLRGRACRRRGARPEGLPAGGHRPPAADRPDRAGRRLELRREPGSLRHRHRPHGGRGRGRRRGHRVGPRDARGRGPGHRRALQLRQLRRGGLRGRGRGRRRLRAAGLDRHRLRGARQPPTASARRWRGR